MGRLFESEDPELKKCMDILRKGVQHWNNWRKDNPDYIPVLFPPGGVELNNLDLSGIDFSNSILQAANFNHSKLDGSKFDNCNLKVAKFNNVDLRNVSFKKANFESTEFKNSVLEGMCFRNFIFKRCKFINANLRKINFRFSQFQEAVFIGADLSDTDMIRTLNNNAVFSNAKLTNTNFSFSDCSNVNFSGANLTNAQLNKCTLSKTNFSNCILVNASLEGAILIDSDLSYSNLDNAKVYGLSAWNLNTENTNQNNLIISKKNEPILTLDNLEIAQFIHLLINNKKIRSVIDTITSKVVLVLGRFTTERKTTLEVVREKLREVGYLPIIFDFEKPLSRDLTETIQTLASLSRFVIADLTDAKSIPQELALIIPNLPSVVIQPIYLKSHLVYAMFEHFTRYPWVLESFEYENDNHLKEALIGSVINPIESLFSQK
jgi:uncharacterized protein YjbI with pentapeptide repeats